MRVRDVYLSRVKDLDTSPYDPTIISALAKLYKTSSLASLPIVIFNPSDEYNLYTLFSGTVVYRALLQAGYEYHPCILISPDDLLSAKDQLTILKRSH